MHRSTRNTLASYALFIYGCLLMLGLIISLESDPTKISYPVSIVLGLITSFLAAVLTGSYEIGLHFKTRTILLFIILTLTQITIWYLICEGSFKFKSDAFG